MGCAGVFGVGLPLAWIGVAGFRLMMRLVGFDADGLYCAVYLCL